MSHLASSLAEIAERLRTNRGTARAGGGVAGSAGRAGVVDLTGILAMPLDRFARDGQLLEVRVPWLEVTLWFAPEKRDAQALIRDGVSRGRV